MWKEMARIISEVRLRYAFVENSPMLTTRGLGTVLADLAKMGFDAEWGVLSAADVGANHKRERIWIVAKISNTDSMGWQEGNYGKLEANKTIRPSSTISVESSIKGFNRNGWKTEPSICRVVNGMADAMDRLKAIGNGQVPQVAAVAWELLTERLDERYRPQ
jgi:DNA (cytosine-5)-methyltransferase 1